ncbi:hypothetical protein EDB85DRAFT_1944703 [Lactarius pseudohatsudake]|nr:hypothetical protein EDB85DRAFT_1944703 [Lactarius pseudohatsudake]
MSGKCLNAPRPSLFPLRVMGPAGNPRPLLVHPIPHPPRRKRSAHLRSIHRHRHLAARRTSRRRTHAQILRPLRPRPPRHSRRIPYVPLPTFQGTLTHAVRSFRPSPRRHPRVPARGPPQAHGAVPGDASCGRAPVLCGRRSRVAAALCDGERDDGVVGRKGAAVPDQGVRCVAVLF